VKRTRLPSIAQTVNLRPLAIRVIASLLLLGSFSFVIISKTHENVARTVRTNITETVVPLISILSKPVDAMASLSDWAHELITVREENRALKSENSRLRQWQAVATEVQSENTKLRELLKFAPANKSAYTSARVAADTTSPYSRSALITSGSDQGVQEDLAVVNDGGLVGRVVEVGKKTSRILLLTDMNSRIPVLSENSRERAIAGGGSGDNLSLLYLPENSKMKMGEKIITSGDGGVLPPGLPVGVVVKIDKGTAIVKPFVDWYHLEYVSVVDFSM